jgi:Na+/glutamate symporter
MRLPGFTSGQKGQNAVVAGMYFVALAAIVVTAATFGGFFGGAGGDIVTDTSIDRYLAQ